MIKWVFIILHFSGLLLYNFLFQEDVAINITAPAMVTGGDEFEVTVSLSKGNIESFSRLMQELPAGLQAISVNTSNSDFSFNENRVRMIWLKMPEDEIVTVSYLIKSDKRLIGSFELGAKFSFIQDNERRSVEAEPLLITINPNPETDPSLLVDVKDFKDNVIPDLTPRTGIQVACIREVPRNTYQPDGGIVVNLLVSKQNAEKFAKIEETIPDGYTALKIDAKGGIFSYKDGKAKFLWMNLPKEPYFIVSYRLIPNSGVTGTPSIKGQFSYVVDEKNKIVDIVERDILLTSLNPDSVNQLVASVISTATSNTPNLIAQVQSTENEPTENTGKQVKKTVWERLKGKLDKRFMLEPEEGVYYRVQLAAGHRKININNYFKRLNVSDEVRVEEHEGWRKYSIGSFADYKQARDYRVHIWNTTPVGDAFVSAYNNGKRITVQEALMISNQQWYR